jgi:DNA-binding XRE family transcriptional regulator
LILEEIMGTTAVKPYTASVPFAGKTTIPEIQPPANRLPSKNTKLFGYRLQALRKAHGLTQEALSEKMDVPPSYVSRAENGLGLPLMDHQFKMAKGLGMTFSEFFNATWGNIYDPPTQ